MVAQILAAQDAAPDPQPTEPVKAPEPHESPPDPQPPAKNRAEPRSGPCIDYDQANQALFDQFCLRGGEIHLEARLAVHEHGAEARACDVAEAIEGKADVWQRRTWGRVVIGPKTTAKMLTSSASFWIGESLAGRGKIDDDRDDDRDERRRAREVNDRDRKAYIGRTHHKGQYDDDKAKRGRDRSAQIRTQKGQLKAALVHCWQHQGLTLRQIEAEKGIARSTASDAKRRDVRLLLSIAFALVRFGKLVFCTRQNPIDSSTENPLPSASEAPQRPESVHRLRCRAKNAAHKLQLWLNLCHDRPGHRYRSGQHFEDEALYSP